LAAFTGLYSAITANMPQDITITPQGLHQVIVVASAAPLVNLQATTVPSPVVGTVNDKYAAGMGVRIDWKTSQVKGRRFIRGNTFIVPLANLSYAPNGSMDSAFLSTLNTAVAAMINAMTTAGLQLIVYSRPKKGTTSGGGYGPVDAWTTPSTPAGLRSRRS
jgi:hypothetical protein